MAKISTLFTSIEGFDAMSAEDKITAISNLDLPEPDLSGYVTKATFDATASEAADYKKKYRDTLSEAERKEAEAQEAKEQMANQLKSLLREKDIADYTAKYVGMGYPSELALATATAMADGDIGKVFENQQTFLGEHEKQVKESMLKGSSTPPKGTGSSAITLEAFRKMSYTERAKFASEHPDEYQALYQQ